MNQSTQALSMCLPGTEDHYAAVITTVPSQVHLHTATTHAGTFTQLSQLWIHSSSMAEYI